MNLITDKLPSAIIVDGISYEIQTDFRKWISFCEIAEDRKRSDIEKISAAYEMFRNDKPQDITAAYSAVCGFATCSDMPKCGKGTGSQNSTGAPCLSWTYDAPFIIGAFRQVYGIDIMQCRMHWYTFISLFMALPDDTPIKQRMSMRRINTAEIKDNEKRCEILRIQRAVAIPADEMSAYEMGEALM